MPDISYMLYDTAIFGVTANTEHVLFQVAQGADAVHTEQFTNSRGAGVLPQQEQMVVNRVCVWQDFAPTTVVAARVVWLQSFLEIRVADETLLKIPIIAAAYRGAVGAVFGVAVAADNAWGGPMGEGYYLDNPIVIPGGTGFRVRVLQSLAAVAAASNMKVALSGVLTIS